MSAPITVSFLAGETGQWSIDSIEQVVGESLPSAARLKILTDEPVDSATAIWTLKGVTSNSRYASRAEIDALGQKQQGLGREDAVCAALIPIRKTAAWWTLAQDERRDIMEERSRHFTIGMAYLPAISRRLHHSCELGEPFDFLTWFEFAPEHTEAFDEMVRRLRDTEEWRYVDREIDIRLKRS